MEVRLPRGHFCGELLKRDEVGGFVLTEYVYPPELKISKHLHEQVYFCVVLQGNYTETYGKKTRACGERTVTFHPAGELHSDNFHKDGGRIFSVEIEPRWVERVGELSSILEYPESFCGALLASLVVRTYKEFYEIDAASRLAIEGLSLEVVAEALRQSAGTPVKDTYGYGWNIKETSRKTRLIEHGGDFAGFGSQFSWFKDEQVLVISLCNIRHDNNEYPTRFKADPKVINIIFNEPYTPPPAFIATDPAVIKKTVGAYQLPSGGKFVVRVDRGQLEIGADGQDAADALAEADEKDIERRKKLLAMTKTFLESMVDWNPKVVQDALGPNGDLEYWRAGWTDESRQLGEGKGKLKSIEVLGVVPGGYPRGIQNATARFNYEKGSSPYKITWLYRERFSKDIIGGTYLRSADLSAETPLQPESSESFAGWNIIAEKGFRVSFEFASGRATGLKIQGKNAVWSARRLP